MQETGKPPFPTTDLLRNGLDFEAGNKGSEAKSFMETGEGSILVVGKGGLPPLFRIARFESGGGKLPFLPLIFFGMNSTLRLPVSL